MFVLDFLKTQSMLDANQVFKDDLKRRLDHAINTPLQTPSLTPAPEKLPKKSGGRRFADSGINLWRMVAGGRPKEAHPMLNSSALGIASPVIQTSNAGEGDRCGA